MTTGAAAGRVTVAPRLAPERGTRKGVGMRRRRTRALHGAVTLLVVALLAGACASSEGSDESSATTVAGGAAPTRAPGQWTGDYRIRGNNPDGSRYRGTLEIEGEPDGVLTLNWDTNGSYDGVGIVEGDVLAGAHGDDGDVCNAAAFVIADDGSLSARWASFDGRGPSTEDAAAVVPGPPGVAGSYAIEGVNADGNAYSGSMDLVASGAAFEVVRQVGGILVRGSAIKEGNVLALTFGDETCAVVVYRQGADGQLRGRWGASGVQTPGRERAVPE